MGKTIIDERTGWEYELIGEQFYPTGRIMKDWRLQSETVDANNEPEAENRLALGPIGTCGTSNSTRKTCTLIYSFPGG